MTNKLLQEQSDEILRQSQSKDPSERSMAIYNLGVAGQKDDPNVDEALRKALKDEDAMIRAQAVSSIAQRGGENVADNLQEALKDKDANVRLTAVNNIKDDETLLQLASGDSDKSVSHIAQKRLDALMANRHR
jgi:HEAT repeat protein